ncbi:MAG: enoyl-CoA hydratase-related protein, partial [Dehalococcoidia bacterium]
MAFETILYEVDGPVATVTLNRPERRNAQSRKLLEEMDTAFSEAVADDAVRVIVLAGAGDTFSAGHDLSAQEGAARAQRSPGLVGRYTRVWELYVDMGLRWRDLPKPTIAAVQGYCIFGGWMIATAMDLIVAAEDAKFLASHFQYFSVPYDLTPRKAKELLFEFRFMHADEALTAGF